MFNRHSFAGGGAILALLESVLRYSFNQFFLMRWPTGTFIKGLSYGLTAGSLAGNMWCTKLAIDGPSVRQSL